MKKIPLYWFQKDGEHGNFGDELGPYIINKISGKEIYPIPIPRSSFKLILAYIKGLVFGIFKFNILGAVFNTLILNGKYIISIGSIIGWGSGRRIVWGSGILFSEEKIDNGDFVAVRGKYTQKRLKSLGYKSPDILGDPALLLPLVYKPNVPKNHKLGLVPHHTQYEHFASYEQIHGIKVINLIGDIEHIIDEINECEYILSSSLHGLIVAHAYEIPAIWYEYPKIKWHGENIKFLDYFSSIGIAEYSPLPLMEIADFDAAKEQRNLLDKIEYATIKVDLTKIQKGLLGVAPFPVLKKFRM